MRFFNFFISIVVVTVSLSSCINQEDPGPIQFNEQLYAITDFDRLDMGDAMYVTVTQGNIYKVEAQGDRRNLDDLVITKVGNTLTARFDDNRNRRHTTYISITMPELSAANFYGATTASVSGFETDNFTLNLSGASLAQLDITANSSSFSVSGASNLSLSGSTLFYKADISGASLIKAYHMEAEDVEIVASGASHGYVKANHSLSAKASGASSILYRGEPAVNSEVSGGSSVMKD